MLLRKRERGCENFGRRQKNDTAINCLLELRTRTLLVTDDRQEMVKGILEELDVSHSWDDDTLFEERGCSVAAPSAL